MKIIVHQLCRRSYPLSMWNTAGVALGFLTVRVVRMVGEGAGASFRARKSVDGAPSPSRGHNE
eukprot:6810305-Pyramimonas_sp.AAC.2